MTSALLYPRTQHWQIWVAFMCAIALHFAAISLARNAPETPSFPPSTDGGLVVAIDPPPDQLPIQPDEPMPPEPSEFVKQDETFPEDSSSPAPISAKKRKPMSLNVKSPSAPGVSGPSLGSVKVLAIYAPRPGYPYEARRQHATGSGVVVLMIDSSSGSVTDARIVQSTGSAVLDNSAVSAFRRWRFRPGTVTRVQVPITYTLSGASY